MKAIVKVKRTVESTDPKDSFHAVEVDEGADSPPRICIQQDEDIIVVTMDMAIVLVDAIAALVYEMRNRPSTKGEGE